MKLSTSGRLPPSPGFTRADLIAVIASVSLLSLLILGAGASTRSTADTMICSDRLRQLQRACSMYAADSGDWLPGNYSGDLVITAGNVPAGFQMPWAPNFLTWDVTTSNTNRILLGRSALAPYLQKNLSAFRCPADRSLSPSQRARGFKERIRSFSMNAFIGPATLQSRTDPFPSSDTFFGRFTQYHLLRSIADPSRRFVLLEEHEDSVNDGLFLIDPRSRQWVDTPAGRHSSGANFTFADEHVELRRWKDPAPKAPVRFIAPTSGLVRVTADFQWIAERATETR